MLPHFPLLHNSLSSLLHAIKFLHCPSTIPCFFKALLASAHRQQLIFQGFTIASPHVQNSVLTTFCYLTKALKTKIIHFFNLMNFWFDQVVISLVSSGVSNVAELRRLWSQRSQDDLTHMFGELENQQRNGAVSVGSLRGQLLFYMTSRFQE